MTIEDAIKKMSNDPSVEIYSAVAKVKSVDESKRVCDVELVESGNEIFDCRLQSVISGADGIVVIPEKDSFVIVTFISKIHAFVSLTSKIKKIVVDFPELSGTVDDIKIKDTKIVLNDGNNFGLVKVKELTEKINAIEKDLNTIKGVFSGWTPAPMDGGGALKGAASTWASQIMTTTTQSDIENPDIKH